jgi:hypothetical protein
MDLLENHGHALAGLLQVTPLAGFQRSSIDADAP